MAHGLVSVPTMIHHHVGIGQFRGKRLAVVDNVQIVASADGRDNIISPGGEKFRFDRVQ